MSAPPDQGHPMDFHALGFEAETQHPHQDNGNNPAIGVQDDPLIREGLQHLLDVAHSNPQPHHDGAGTEIPSPDPLFAAPQQQQHAQAANYSGYHHSQQQHQPNMLPQRQDHASVRPHSSLVQVAEAANALDSGDDLPQPPPTKKQRRRYDNNFKAEVLQHLKMPGAKLPAISKQFGIPENTVREWTKVSVVQAIETARAKNSGELKANLFDPMHRLTKSLVEFFEQNQAKPPHIRQPITTKLVVAKGLEAKKDLLELHRTKQFLNPMEYKALNKFTGSDSWAKKFARKHNLKMTGARIKDLSEGELKQFHHTLKQMESRVKQAGPRYEEISSLIRQAGEKLLLARSSKGYHEIAARQQSKGPSSKVSQEISATKQQIATRNEKESMSSPPAPITTTNFRQQQHAGQVSQQRQTSQQLQRSHEQQVSANQAVQQPLPNYQQAHHEQPQPYVAEQQPQQQQQQRQDCDPQQQQLTNQLNDNAFQDSGTSSTDGNQAADPTANGATPRPPDKNHVASI